MSQLRKDQLYDAPKVGGDILAWCTRCKMELAHVVAAMVAGKPARVICKTCRSEHNYKRGGSATPARVSGTSKPKETRTTMRAADYWDKKMAELSKNAILTYSPRSRFKKNELIQHPNFGVGIVEELRSGNKILVTFRLGEKVLVHGMVAPQ